MRYREDLSCARCLYARTRNYIFRYSETEERSEPGSPTSQIKMLRIGKLCKKNPMLLILASCIFPSALSLKSVSWPHDLKRAVSWLWCWCPSEWVLSSSQSILKANLDSALVGNLFSWNLFLHLTPCMLYEILGLLTGLWNLRWISVRICY